MKRAADNDRMTVARQILPGTTYLVTRRVTQRMFLLKPTEQSVQVLLYCIHRAAQMYNIDIHSVQVPDNHAHITLTDPDGRLPEFMAWLNREVAKCMNKLYKRSEQEVGSRAGAVAYRSSLSVSVSFV